MEIKKDKYDSRVVCLSTEETNELHAKGYLVVADYCFVYDKNNKDYYIYSLFNDYDIIYINCEETDEI